MNARVAALVATYRRPIELTRLLDALAAVPHGLDLVVVVDNAGSEETRALLENARCPTRYVAPGENLGCGGGLKRAGEEALRVGGATLTHLWILDDDALPTADTLSALLDAMAREGADAACPLVLGPDGRLGWTPGFKSRVDERAARLCATPEELRARFGSAPLPFTWTQGISLLVSRRAVETLGLHRPDFWVRGEDLEWSLRLTARYRGIVVPTVVVQHLPPAEISAASRKGEYLKHAAMLQNIVYLSLRLPHGRRIARSIVPTIARFVRMWGMRSIIDVARALVRGAVQAEPAGTGTGATFNHRSRSLG